MPSGYRVRIETKARKALLSFPKDAVARLIAAIDDLERFPRPPGAKKLSGVDGYRLRCGAYRILYTVDDKAKTVFILVVGHRRDVYRRR